jgi:hypothetical protein
MVPDTCAACGPGLNATARPLNTTASGYGYTCVDIDECAANASLCAAPTQCVNTFGGYECTPRLCSEASARLGLPAGLYGTGETGCFDINECKVGNGGCVHGQCNNTYGSRLCLCDAGYSGEACHVDIDECASQPCRNGGSCVDGANEFACVCVGGYTGGLCAVDIDECASQPCQVSFVRCSALSADLLSAQCSVPRLALSA